jgi:hypothetical protein
METAVVGRGLPAKQLIRRADRKRRTVREKPMLHIILSCNLSNLYRIRDRVPCAFESQHTSYIKGKNLHVRLRNGHFSSLKHKKLVFTKMP